MRKLMLVLAMVNMVLFFSAVGIAGDEKKTEPQYEVSINVVYNEVTADKAAELIKAITKQHGTACKVEVKVKKVPSYQDDYNITFIPGTTSLIYK